MIDMHLEMHVHTNVVQLADEDLYRNWLAESTFAITKYIYRLQKIPLKFKIHKGISVRTRSKINLLTLIEVFFYFNYCLSNLICIYLITIPFMYKAFILKLRGYFQGTSFIVRKLLHSSKEARLSVFWKL